ncbi:outer membrane lipoprotein carrier protein LolA [Aquimarina sp. MMG015]|uniref:LolA family protein n=1 Tax=unclassified Aquimarina TaxID=2627091 RepID=UPI000E50ED4A|nr:MULTISPECIES: outer membrane lipoprotein carrier protein LolA [unclassified Aquimarina]AXT55642.1 outer membrane lipoprotein carrier protein LolA [Aquimarina sp. AD1]MBQ4804419.1 outer membrane lipoprotein carrier protein LolA [Aquimarina sp. MMG015]RKN24974.1 outer membrane lipoprotein carrier protein LolA [Aquimarina sp. AD1]
MIHRIFFLVVTLFIANTQAQDAKKLLDEVSTKVKSYDNIVIGFKYALNNPAENVSQETRGDVTLLGEKYLLNLMGTEQMYDGKKLHMIVPEDEEINISSQSAEDESSVTPSKMLTFYEDGYTSKLDIVQDVQGRKIQFVKLIPIDSNSELKEILLGVDKQTKHIYKLILMQNNGTNITITVNSFKTNQPLSKTLFVFDESKYANYYINRLD